MTVLSLLKKSETSGTSRAPSPTNGENTLFVCRGEQRLPAYFFRTFIFALIGRGLLSFVGELIVAVGETFEDASLFK